MHEGAALAQVGEGHGVLAQPQVARDALEGGALEAGRAAGDDQVIEAALLDGVGDLAVTLGAAEELLHRHSHDAVQRARLVAEVLEVEDAGDVAAALAEEDTRPHDAPAVRCAAAPLWVVTLGAAPILPALIVRAPACSLAARLRAL